MANMIQKLYGSGADAFSNLFEVAIDPPSEITSGEDDTSYLGIRAQDFTPPQFKWSTYDFKHGALTTKKLNSKIEGERMFTLKFRSDAGYRLYDLFKRWEALSGDLFEGANHFSDIMDVAGDKVGRVAVSALTSVRRDELDRFYESDRAVIARNSISWVFKEVSVTAVSEPRFTQGTANTQDIEVRFAFQTWDRPYWINGSLQ